MASREELAIIKKDTVDVVANEVRKLQECGQLFFPANYNPENAMKAAWLTIQETKDKSDRPALEVCTKNSIANALLGMVVQGLNPAKKQCYFIVYGSKLVLQRSYFGSMHIAKTVDPNIEDIFAYPVYKNELFKTSIVKGRTVVMQHIPEYDEEKRGAMVGAYCQVLYKDGRENTTYMTMTEIKKAWSMSPTKPIDVATGELKATSTHAQFTAEMAKKTVVNKACKPIINSSNDSSLLVKVYNHTQSDIAEAEAEEEIYANANSQPIDIDFGTGEVKGVTSESSATTPSGFEDIIDAED